MKQIQAGRPFDRSILLAALVALVVSLGCSLPTYHASRDSRRALEACEAEHGPGAEACEAERVRAGQEYDRYEDRARDRWSCSAGGPESNCPPER